jgi:hypothetical protein
MDRPYNGIMATHIGIGFSSTTNPIEAFKAASIEAKTQLNAVHTDLAIVFTTSGYSDPQGLETLQRILQPTRLIGSITPGIILGNRVETRGVGVMAVISDDWHFSTANLDQLNLIPERQAGYNLAQSLLGDHKFSHRSACVYFYDGLRKNGTHFCAGVREELGNALPIVGAIGVDSTKIAYTQHFYQDRILGDAAVGLLIGGASVVSVSARHSWQPLGKPRIIDGARGNIIQTINKEPAAQLYENYFHSSDTALRTDRIDDIRLLYPLGIGTSTPREYLIRMPIDIPDDGSILCQGDIMTGSPVHLMITDKDACRQNIHDAAMEIRTQLFGKQPKLILVFESLMRRKILGHSAAQGIHAIQEVLGRSVPVFGMYTAGEAAPLKTVGAVAGTQLLNGSVVLLAIG